MDRPTNTRLRILDTGQWVHRDPLGRCWPAPEVEFTTEEILARAEALSRAYSVDITTAVAKIIDTILGDSQ